MPRIRQTEIDVRRRRKKKLQKLREKFTAAKSGIEKEKAVRKLGRIAPWLSKEQFLAPLKGK